MTADRDVEKSYSLPEFVAELRRLADALEAGQRFEIQLDGEQVFVPDYAVASIEHEREDGREEIEFQLTWEARAGENKAENDGDADIDVEDEADSEDKEEDEDSENKVAAETSPASA